MEELGQNRASRWAQNVVLAIEEQNDWSSDEQHSWKEECEPKANKLLDVSVKGEVSMNAGCYNLLESGGWDLGLEVGFHLRYLHLFLLTPWRSDQSTSRC